MVHPAVFTELLQGLMCLSTRGGRPDPEALGVEGKDSITVHLGKNGHQTAKEFELPLMAVREGMWADLWKEFFACQLLLSC